MLISYLLLIFDVQYFKKKVLVITFKIRRVYKLRKMFHFSVLFKMAGVIFSSLGYNLN